MIALLNTSILTSFGSYSYESISLDKAKELVANGHRSHIGHESTASVMSALLDTYVAFDRTPYSQQVGDRALVFKLNGRPPEGRILTREEIESIGYTWGLLIRTA